MITWLLLYIDLIKICISFISILINLFLHLSKFISFINNTKFYIMAKIRQGILGGVSGKIGNVVGSSWKGIAVLRAKALSISNPNTTAQVTQRGKFADIVTLASLVLSSIIVPLWNRFAVRMSGYNAFVKSNIGAIVDGSVVDPSRIFISVGKMATTAFTVNALTSEDSQLVIEWTAGLSDPFQANSDKCFCMVLSSDAEVLFAGDTDRNRAYTTASVDLSRSVNTGEFLYVWVSFLRENGTMVSTSDVRSVAVG